MLRQLAPAMKRCCCRRQPTRRQRHRRGHPLWHGGGLRIGCSRRWEMMTTFPHLKALVMMT
jgi:hypothetical protein